MGNGACFPLHYDNPGRPSKRKLTCLVYLNPDWKPGDGGELKLFPFLEEPITIEPKFDRCVIFVSDLILHRVLPCFAPRFCFTIWSVGLLCMREGEMQGGAEMREREEAGKGERGKG